MTIKVWNTFDKRVNSTKQPTGGTQISVVLKENCSIENPVFILSSPIADYEYVEAFGRYYFVSDVVNLNAAQSEIHCGLDPMATYKSEIGNTTAFVLYDTTTNTSLNDPRLSKVSAATVSKNKVKLHAGLSTVGSFIVTTTGVNNTSCYVISSLDVNKLIPDIATQVDNLFYQGFSPAGDWTDFTTSIVHALRQIMSSGNISSNIRDLRWIPFNISGTGSHTVYVGMYDTGITNVGKLSLSTSNRIDARSVSISIPWQYSDWRNAYCTDIYLHIPYVGDVSFPADKLIGETGIMLNVSADMVTGDLAIVITGSTTGVYLGSYGASTGVTIPIGNASPNLNKMVTSLFEGLGSVKASGSIGGMFTSGANAVSNIVTSIFTPFTQTVGGLSSAAASALPFDAELVLISHDTNVSPSSVSSAMGTPAMAVKTINTLTGYIQCSGASVSGSMHAADREAINSMLNGGFFYE